MDIEVVQQQIEDLKLFVGKRGFQGVCQYHKTNIKPRTKLCRVLDLDGSDGIICLTQKVSTRLGLAGALTLSDTKTDPQRGEDQTQHGNDDGHCGSGSQTSQHSG